VRLPGALRGRVSLTALILQHGDWGPPAILAEWCAARGIAFEVHHAQSRAPLPELNGQAFVAFDVFWERAR
jgi:hypothetical protein